MSAEPDRGVHLRSDQPYDVIRVFLFECPAAPEIYTLSLHDALPIAQLAQQMPVACEQDAILVTRAVDDFDVARMHGELRRVAADRAQPPGEAAEHRIGEETAHMPKRTRIVSISCPVGCARSP